MPIVTRKKQNRTPGAKTIVKKTHPSKVKNAATKASNMKVPSPDKKSHEKEVPGNTTPQPTSTIAIGSTPPVVTTLFNPYENPMRSLNLKLSTT